MLSKSIILLALTSFALAIPEIAVKPVCKRDTIDTPELADANELLEALASIPILGPSTQEILTTIPDVDLASPEIMCDPSTASWFGDLPTEVQTALTTYVESVQSWVMAHPNIVESYGASLPAGFTLCEDKGETTSTSSSVATSTGSATSSGEVTSTASTTASETTGSTPISTSSATISSGPISNSSTTAASPTPTEFSTSTIYATLTSTISSCAPTVTNCPYGSVTTITTAISTTICPITATPTPTLFTTSTVYATLTSTISSCAPTVANCPYGSVTTVTIPISTTICPVTDGENASQTSVAGGLVPTGGFTTATNGIASPTAAGPTATPAPFTGVASRVSGTFVGCMAGIIGVIAFL